jgi:exodeoxyribonuclease VII small subunit
METENIENVTKSDSLETKMNQLNEIIKQMSSSDVSLEASFKLYKEGVKTLKECTDMVDKIEKELIVLEEGEV